MQGLQSKYRFCHRGGKIHFDPLFEEHKDAFPDFATAKLN